MLLGSGELGKEFAISAQRLGLYVVAVDRYKHAPAMHVSHESHVINMQDADALHALVQSVKPDYIVPEIEAIATDELIKLEKQGFNVVPCAVAAKLTMDRQGIRALAACELQLPTSTFVFADSKEEYLTQVRKIGLPCVIKPVMSSSGKGQSIVNTPNEIEAAWSYAQKASRGNAKKVIIEAFIDFDYEITLLTVRHKKGTSFCDPIGHIQQDGDYRLSWQPHAMSDALLSQAQHIAKTVTDALGGYGIFGVELFIKGDEVFFNEVSPRPHDTGMVTLISQNLSEFDLHLRAILGLPIPNIETRMPSASAAILLEGESTNPRFEGLNEALLQANTDVRLFAKPEISGKRRMGVALAYDCDIETAKNRAKRAANLIKLHSPQK
jgi:phosphoribosylglycinamide formyltransferase 2